MKRALMVLMLIAGLVQLIDDAHASRYSVQQFDKDVEAVLACTAEKFPNAVTDEELEHAWYACGGWDNGDEEWIYETDDFH